MSAAFSLTPLQKRDKKIKDLEIKLRNERNARRNGREEFEYGCAQCKEKSGNNKYIISMPQRSVISRTEAIGKMRMIISGLKKRIAGLEDKAAVLDGRIKKDSTNSGKPPSFNGFKKPRIFSTRKKAAENPESVWV